MVQLQDIAGWAYIFVQKCGQEMEKTHETMQKKCIMHTFGMFTIHQHDIPFFPGGFRHIAELFWTWQAFFHRSPDYDPVGYDEDIPRSFAQSGWAKAWEKTAYNKDDAMDHEFCCLTIDLSTLKHQFYWSRVLTHWDLTAKHCWRISECSLGQMNITTASSFKTHSYTDIWPIFGHCLWE